MTRINTNVSSLVAQQTLQRSNTQLQQALVRLSTGLSINVGKDNPAGLIASEVLRSDIISVERAISNSERASQLISTADSALGQVSSLLNDIRGLVSEAANTGALSDDQIAANQLQVDSSLEAIDRIAQTTVFQGRRLIDGSLDFLTTSPGNADSIAAGTIGSATQAAATAVLTGGNSTELTFTAKTEGTAFDGYIISVTTDAQGSTDGATVAVDGVAKTITFHVESATTAAQLVALAQGNASADALFSVESTGAAAAVDGIAAVTTAGGADQNIIELTANTAGAAFNDVDIKFIVGGAAKGSESATYTGSAGSGLLTVQIAANSTAAEIAAAINNSTNGEFTATATGNGAGIVTATSVTLTDVTTGGVSGGANINNLDIEQANFGTSSQIAVQIDVDTQATRGFLAYSGGNLSADLVLEVGGNSGFEVFNFGNGTTVSQIRDAINLVSDSTGVQATINGTDLELRSSEYGSKSFVSARAISGSFATVDADAASTTRDTGSDIIARINGVLASGDGLKASLNTSTLDLSFNVNSLVGDGESINFNITGGGAIFQLGPDVVSNQQARVGIASVGTATLGGESGTLFELRSGGIKALGTDPSSAAKVVEEVITKVTQLRGRLGAFQKATLETNIFTLSDQLENLTDAESSIRDADFAKESAALTRAQILVQSGTSVLAIANSNPQNVLALLR